MNKDDMSDDAQFEAFLKGEDELSRRLQALPQPSPGAELDAVIMKRVTFALAQQGRPAANDPGQHSAAPMLAPGLGRRWRIPAAIAASVLVGVFAHQAFDASNSQMALPQEEAPAMIVMEQPSAPAQIMPPPPPPPAEVEVRQKPPMAAPAPAPAVAVPAPRAAPSPPPPPVKESVVEIRGEKARQVPRESASPVVIMQEPSPVSVPSPAPQVAERVSAAPMEEPAMADQATAPASGKVNITGSRIRPAAPEEVLANIEAMLKAGRDKEALAAWARFREAYPDHAVPKEFEAKIKALQ
ncbi:MAG: hypothetical protein Q7S67_02720 [Telluria sp.]|nr:hypothetical protein [Telluria sp.]